MLPFIKIPCILVSTASIWITFTPPNPSPAENEKAGSVSIEGFIVQRFTLLTIKCFLGGVAFTETAVLVAQHTLDHHHFYSRLLLDHLIFSGGAAERICASRSFLVGTLMTSLGGLIRYKCYQALGSMFTFEMSIRRDHTLVTSGPYAIVRHPGYTGAILVVIGLLLIHGSKGSWVRESGVLKTAVMKTTIGLICAVIAMIIAGLLIRMSKEDEALHQFAGKEWEEWAKNVTYKLIPFIY